jgi:hypothetical protein
MNFLGAITKNPFAQRMAGSIFSGANAALGDNLTDPNVYNAVSAAKDLVIESLPGNQKTALDNPFSGQEAIIKKGTYLSRNDIASTAVHTNTVRQVGNLRERAMEAVGRGLGGRVAGAIGRRLPVIAGRTAAGAAGSGGLLAPALAIWGAGDMLDAGVEGITGKTILQHAENPEQIRGRWGAKHNKSY